MHEQVKAKLLEEKTRLETELGLVSEEDPQVEGNFVAKFPEYGDDEESSANEVADYGDNLSLNKALEDRLADVNRALGRLEEGKYGLCEICGQPIPEQRLLAMPTATTDVACEEKRNA